MGRYEGLIRRSQERPGLLGLTEQLFDVLLSAECLKDPAGGSHVVIRTYDLRPAIVSCAARAAGWHPAAGWQPACRPLCSAAQGPIDIGRTLDSLPREAASRKQLAILKHCMCCQRAD